MSTHNSEIKVGAAVLSGLIILVCGLIWGRGTGWLDSHQTVHVRFDNVRGLIKGDPVIVRGIKQGRVEEISLQRGFVDVLLWITSDLVLYDDMTLQIEDRELMGGRQISLDPGSSGNPADPQQAVVGSGSSGMMQMLKKAEFVLARADSLFEYLNITLHQPELRDLPKRLDAIAAETAGMIRENRETVHRTAERIDAITRSFDEDSLSTRIGFIIDKMDQLVISLDSTAVSARRVIRSLDSRDGTTGSLIHDRELYDNLLSSSAHMDSLISDIRKHPGKYFKVTIF